MQIFQHLDSLAGWDFQRRSYYRWCFEDFHDTLLALIDLPEHECGFVDWLDLDFCLLRWQERIGIADRELIKLFLNLCPP